MKKNPMPSALEFVALADKTMTDIDVMRMRLARPIQNGLLDAFEAALEPSAHSLNAEFAATSQKYLGDIARSNRAAGWLAQQVSYGALLKSAIRRSAKDDKFADPLMPMKLLAATAFGLFRWLNYLERQTAPNPLGADDWKEAISAVDTLMGFELRGLSLGRAIRGSGVILPYQWLSQIRAAIVEASRSPKPHRDGSNIERDCARHFAYWIYLFFDDVPKTFVEHFGELMDYKSKRLTSTHTPLWVEQFRAHSIL